MNADVFGTGLNCPGCQQPQLFEAPPCADGHGDDCPDRACVECGFAVFLDPQLRTDSSPAVARRAA